MPYVLLMPVGDDRREQIAREDDRTRIFHAAKTRRADDHRELLVWIRSDSLREKLKRGNRRRETLSARAVLSDCGT